MAGDGRQGTRERYAARGEPTQALGAAVAGEVVGTFALVLIGTAAIGTIFSLNDKAPSTVADVLFVALAFGFMVTVIIYSLGHVSGAHINPAVTIALTARGKFPATAAVAYIVAQLAGALFASLLVWGMFGEEFRSGETALGGTAVGDGFSAGGALLTEIVITFLLVLVVMGTATDDRADSPSVGLGIGFVVVALILATAPISGASLNPARSVGPAVVSGSLSEIWIYLIGPIVGGVLAAFVYDLVLRPGSPPEQESAIEERPKGAPATPRA